MPQVLTLTTTAPTFTSNVLTFASVPVTTIQLGASVTGFGIPANTYITAFTTTTITVNNNFNLIVGTVVTITDNQGAVLRSSSDYKIKVPSGGTIRLDTGVNVGQVFVTGNLNVQGSTTTVNTTNLEIEDNIIVLNRNETGVGVTEITAGIEIDRGPILEGNAQFLWDESKSWRDPWSSTTRNGLWVFKTKSFGTINGILTNSIETEGQDLALISRGTGSITVSGTLDYERQILNYNTGNFEVLDDDLIPNIKSVVDKIDYQILNKPSDKIRRDDTQVIVYDYNIKERIIFFSTYGVLNQFVQVNHFLTTNRELGVTVGSFVSIINSGVPALDGTWEVTFANAFDQEFTIRIAAPIILNYTANTTDAILIKDRKSNARVFIDGNVVAEFLDTHIDLFDIRITQSSIEGTISNQDLILGSPGTGSVRIQDSMKIMYTGYASSATPAMELDCVKIYTDPEGAGDTGIYFVNPTYLPDQDDFRRDELISKKKAIAFSILM